MKLKHPELPAILRAEIFHQLGVADPGGGLATSPDGRLVLYGDQDDHEDSFVAVLVDAYNVLNVTNLKSRRRSGDRRFTP